MKTHLSIGAKIEISLYQLYCRVISSNGTTGDLSLILWKDTFQQFMKKEKDSNVKCVKKALVIRVKWKNINSWRNPSSQFNDYQIILKYYSLNVYVISISLLLSMKRHEGYHAYGIPNDFYALHVSVYGIHFTESTVVQSS